MSKHSPKACVRHSCVNTASDTESLCQTVSDTTATRHRVFKFLKTKQKPPNKTRCLNPRQIYASRNLPKKNSWGCVLTQLRQNTAPQAMSGTCVLCMCQPHVSQTLQCKVWLYKLYKRSLCSSKAFSTKLKRSWKRFAVRSCVSMALQRGILPLGKMPAYDLAWI